MGTSFGLVMRLQALCSEISAETVANAEAFPPFEDWDAALLALEEAEEGMDSAVGDAETRMALLRTGVVIVKAMWLLDQTDASVGYELTGKLDLHSIDDPDPHRPGCGGTFYVYGADIPALRTCGDPRSRLCRACSAKVMR